MSRQLLPSMESAVFSDNRIHAYRIWIYDIVSTFGTASETRIGAIVTGGGLDLRRDFTEEVEQITITERGSNTADTTLGATSIRMVIVDESGVFDPVEGTQPQWLKAGNIVRITEGFVGVPESEWVTTFTGTLIGRAGRDRVDRSGNATLQLAAEDRMAGFLKVETTSQSYIQGTDYNFIMRDIAQLNMGLDSSEFDFSSLGAQVTNQAFTQFVDESPIVSIANVLFPLGFVPRFDGDGRLVVRQLVVDKGNDRVYTNDDLIEDISRPYDPNPAQNRVEVKGLASDMTRNFQTPGVVATAGLTQGFFSGDSSILVKFSDDGTIFVNNPRLRVLSSIQGALIPFGQSEELVVDITDTDPGDSSIQGALEGRIEVNGAFYAPLVTSLFAGRLAASAIPDNVVVAGFGASSGSTISIGRLVSGAAAIANGIILATIGKGEYEIIGEPYEYVFEELRGVAEVANLEERDRRQTNIQNHLIDTQTAVDAVALRELRLIRKRANSIGMRVRHDLRLEADDKFRRANGRTYIISGVTRTISRGAVGMAQMTVFETTAGVNP